jgi:glycosyltransferase involved in cell wall biosynthesis
MRLFQVLPSVLRNIDGKLEVDVDFVEALRVYLDHFEEVRVACTVVTKVLGSGLERCVPVQSLPWGPDRLTFVELKAAYDLNKFVRNYPDVKKQLRREIGDADYLVFSPHTLIGDWPTIAIRESIKQKRSYEIEADVVYESLAELELVRTLPWKRFIKRHVLGTLFRAGYRYCLRHSSLALFQGHDVYNAYARYCSNPHEMFYHIPVGAKDHIKDSELTTKLADLDHRPLRICYAGRAVEMKGPLEWLDIINALIKSGVALSATWLGDGPLLNAMQDKIREYGISSSVHLPGLISEHSAVLNTMRQSDIFLFCHKTKESARCLGEALASGCALVGYRSAYAEGLVEMDGGGRLADNSDCRGTVMILQELDHERVDLKTLIQNAAKTGRRFDRESMLRKRVTLIKQYIAPRR